MDQPKHRYFSVEVPLRISFVGGGTDVNPFMSRYGGMVVSATISKKITATLKEIEQDSITIYEVWSKKSQVVEPFLDDSDLPSNLVTGWISLLPRNLRYGLHLEIDSKVPPGSGLGASSAIAVATCKLAQMKLGSHASQHSLAITAYKIEREFLGIAGGCQDHYAAAFGGLNHFIFQNYTECALSPIRDNDSFLRLLFENLTLVWTGVSRNSSEILSDQISKNEQELNTSALLRQKTLVPSFLQSLEAKSLSGVAQLLTESWRIKKKFANGISNAKLDSLFQKCLENGALGGKLLGAGGGGYFLFLSDPRFTQNFRSFLSEQCVEYEEVILNEGLKYHASEH
jgi:D-glycero-alpha-D-manno-heptose-7-phosphate kinase